MSLLDPTMNEVNSIKYSSKIFVQFWSYSLFSLGIIGHSLNICIFTRPTLRSNPCVRYFLASTISGIFVIFITIPIRVLQYVYAIDISGYSDASCKIIIFFVSLVKTLACWYIVLASIDRFLNSSRSATVRGWSTIRVSSLMIFVMVIVVGFFYIYILIQYRIREGFVRCPISQSIPPAFNGIWTFVIFSMGPSVLMLAFGLLTIRNVRHSIQRVTPQNLNSVELQQKQLHRLKATDRQMIQMMIVQCIYFSVLTAPLSINWIYTSTRGSIPPTDLQNAKDDMLIQIFGGLSLTFACTSFYLFTLSSKLFRGELVYLLKSRNRTNNMTSRNPRDRT